MCHNDAPSAGLFYFFYDLFYFIKVAPGKTSGSFGTGFSAGTLISDSYHSDAAGLFYDNGLSCFRFIHAGTESYRTVRSGIFKSRFNTFFFRIHYMVVADIPDIGTNALKEVSDLRIHAVDE